MSWRFRKSIKILPGVRINLNSKSTSVTLGGRGFHKTFSSTGRVTNSFGIPGTGIYYTNTTSAKSRRKTTKSPVAQYNVPVQQEQVIKRQVPVITEAEVREHIEAIYRQADVEIDWHKVLTDDSADSYFKERAERVLDGDIDTYFEIISDVNPLDDLLQYGSEFECGTDDPRSIIIHFQVNSDSVLKKAKKLPKQQYYELLQDYVCGCSIRIARDMFALLPLRHVIVDAIDKNYNILSVDFTKREIDKLDFRTLDASDTVEMFQTEWILIKKMALGQLCRWISKNHKLKIKKTVIQRQHYLRITVFF